MTIPTDIQLGLLERKVGSIVTQRVRDNCNKRYKGLHVIGKHKQISCFGWPPIEPKFWFSGMENEDQYLHLLIDPNNGEIIEENFGIENEGSNMPLLYGIPFYALSIIGITFLPFYIYDQLSPSRCIARKKRNTLYDLRELLGTENHNEIKELAKSVEVYSDSAEELSNRLCKPIKIIETGTTEHFLKADNLDFLKVRTIFLGGNAITKYSYYNTLERNDYQYWNPNLGCRTTNSHITHMHMGIPIKID